MTHTIYVPPKIRQSLQGDWWVIDGALPKYKFELFSSAVIAVKAMVYDYTGHLIMSTEIDIKFARWI